MRTVSTNTSLYLAQGATNLRQHITELRLRARVERAERHASGLQRKVNVLRCDVTRHKNELGSIKDELAICRREK